MKRRWRLRHARLSYAVDDGEANHGQEPEGAKQCPRSPGRRVHECRLNFVSALGNGNELYAIFVARELGFFAVDARGPRWKVVGLDPHFAWLVKSHPYLAVIGFPSNDLARSGFWLNDHGGGFRQGLRRSRFPGSVFRVYVNRRLVVLWVRKSA